MTSVAKNPLHRLWSKGKEGVYLVNTNNEQFSSPRNHKRPIHSNSRASVRSYSLENADDSAKKHQQIPRDSSFDDSMLEENRSLDSFADEEDVWESMLPDENVMLLSTHRKGSLALDQILLDINTEKKENGVKKPENENDEYADIDVKAIAAAISKQRDSAGSEMDSDSDTDTAVSEGSEGSDLDDDSSDEESDGESEEEAFDIEYHINKLVKGNNESDSDDNDSDSDGNESVSSEKVFQKAVQKVIKKIKRERCGEIKGSDSESTQTSEKGSETEESPTSDDSASETSDQENDASDVSSRKSFQMERDDEPEIAELVDDGLVIDPRNGKHNGKETQTVYKYDLNKNEPINSSPETEKSEEQPEKAESYSVKAVGPPKENGKDHADDLASTLEDGKAQDLRWPFSNFYIKEFKQDPEMSFSDSEDALPSYRSTAASASYPGRKKNVMLGRVWWVEWWAKDDSRKQESPDKFNVVKLS